MRNRFLILGAVVIFTTAVIGGSAQRAARNCGLDSARTLTLDAPNFADLKKDGAVWERSGRLERL